MHIASALSLNAMVFTATPALAKIGEGDLPDGSMAFSKILKYQGEWNKLGSSFKTRGAEMGDPELLNAKFFFKQLANEYGDMELLAKGITDPQKAKQAKELAKSFRTKVRECDDAATKGDIAKIQENYVTTAGQLTTFLELLQDVPDEL
jgi:hypothetical protein